MSNSERAIKRLHRIYGTPRTTDVQGFVGEYERALNAYSPETLDKAIDVVVQNFRPFASQPWPAISDIVKACKKVCETITDGKSEMDKIRAKVSEAKREAKIRAAWWLEQYPLGKQALMEGWSRELWEWVSQVYANAAMDGKRIAPQKIRFDPERIAYARENCRSESLLDLMVIFGSREKALEVYQAVNGEEWQEPERKPHIGKPTAKMDWQRATAAPFKAMQQASPNRELHREVSSITKRITGERE